MTAPSTATPPSGPATPPYPRLFSPIDVGTMRLRNRVVLPPHASAIGNVYGTEEEAARNIAYFVDRCRDGGAGWVSSLSTHVANTLIPGFEPTGVGAATTGFFRLPFFVERVQQFCDSLHALGTSVSVQMVHQGGMPHGASAVMSAPTINLVPHVMTRADIEAFVREYAESARLSQAGRADGVELHLNHDDLHEWFLSPLTNHREDAYGGSLENRCRFSVETLRAIREVVGDTMTVGVRLNVREEVPGGYGVDEGVEIAQYLESTGLIDYVHGVVGSPWGNPSYIQPTYVAPAQFAPLVGELRKGVGLPVVYTGRVTDPDVAEHVLAAGHADLVGMARAHIADGDLLRKARAGRTAEIRPCVGGNECISRRYVEGLPFGCAVNPTTSHEVEGPWPRAASRRRLVVVGGGPAGMELAALAAEGGLSVTLLEAEDELGGQLRYVVRAPRHEGYTQYLDWQRRRLTALAVDVRTGCRATAGDVRALGPDVVAVATGAGPRTPAIDGVTAGHVHDVRDVLAGRAAPGRRVAVVAQDDHVAPLSVADSLAERGCEVTVVYATAQPAPLLGRYIVGAILGRLDARDVRFRFMEEVVGIGRTTITTRNVYSGVVRTVGEFDSVVLACGSVSDSGLYDELAPELPEVHVLGDAYAPRRLVFATRQAHALAQELVTAAA
ncbi:NADH:flavin oxidoreductase [Geodermatophilus sp. TF02-6]|uniref:oxidoreductase n=1 Tax=Geodermatophilus sp. TF02-6 TaxID=2250575 RepID=UPI000DE9BCB2|nr:FAD-dependent oxidoreductase [Geodermatophilus sp. TF02-6]RBY83688.1 NADH:flavin oxidoreductase [Geodermatophilus sp. TF02-6]